jgi:hypothetical protein
MQMADLSPEALAVICAAQAANQDDISSIVAAALRTASLTLSYRWSSDECIEHLVVMANELENHEP